MSNILPTGATGLDDDEIARGLDLDGIRASKPVNASGGPAGLERATRPL